ncbi:MAG: hypothetical protein WKF79_03870 [Nocardioides sp.]
MPSMTIRDVPEETRAELAARAARSGRSMQEYLRLQLIELAARPDPREFWAQVRENKRIHGTHIPTELIIEARDAERRGDSL